jgi:membrane protein implicated in regulation of membrane protease activity
MYLVGIGWLYVAFMMALVEATSPQGSVVGAAFTFLMYGLAPVALLLYILGTPGRKRRLREAQQRADAAEKAP